MKGNVNPGPSHPLTFVIHCYKVTKERYMSQIKLTDCRHMDNRWRFKHGVALSFHGIHG